MAKDISYDEHLQMRIRKGMSRDEEDDNSLLQNDALISPPSSAEAIVSLLEKEGEDDKRGDPALPSSPSLGSMYHEDGDPVEILRRQNEALRRTLAEQTLQVKSLKRELQEHKDHTEPKLKVMDLSAARPSRHDLSVYSQLHGTRELEHMELSQRDSRTGRFMSMDAGQFDIIPEHGLDSNTAAQVLDTKGREEPRKSFLHRDLVNQPGDPNFDEDMEGSVIDMSTNVHKLMVRQSSISKLLDKDEEQTWRALRKRDSQIAKDFRETASRHEEVVATTDVTSAAASEKVYEKGTTREIVRYHVNRYLETSQVAILLAAMGVIIVLGGLMFSFFHPPKEAFWNAVSVMADPGNLQDVSADGERVLAFFVAAAGVVYFSAVIGFIVENVIEFMHALRKGRNDVVVEDHHLILGWNDSALALVEELCEAMYSEGGGTIVILADKMEKLEMEEEIRSISEKLKGSTVVCRFGNPQLHSELYRVRAWCAKSVIILAVAGAASVSDTQLVRVLLSLRGLQRPVKGHIVTEIRDADDVAVVEMVGGDQVVPMVIHDIVGRLMIQSMFEPGLAGVWAQLLGFEGSEFYLQHWPELDGKMFGEVLFMFEAAIPIGVLRADTNEVMINPNDHYVLSNSDELIVIAEDDDTYFPGPMREPDGGRLPAFKEDVMNPEAILICGWRRDIDSILRLLEFRMAEGSEVHVLANVPAATRQHSLEENGFFEEHLANITIHHYIGEPPRRRTLESLNIPLHRYRGILILSDERYEHDAVRCDSHSLSALLMVGDLLTEKPEEMDSSFVRGVVTEILDLRTQESVKTDKAVKSLGDFMMSTRLASNTLAMLAENRKVKQVLEKLLSSKGADLTLRFFEQIGIDGEILNIWSLTKRLRQRGDILVGYWLVGEEEPITNPEFKDETREWRAKDRIIVLKPAKAKTPVDLIAEGDMLRKSAGKLPEEQASRKATLYAESIAAYATAMDIDPTNALAPYGRGVAERKRGNNKAAEEAFRISLDMDPNGQGGKFGKIGGVIRGAVWNNLGSALLKQKKV